MNIYIDVTAEVDLPCDIGDGTKIWHFSHIMYGAKIGKNCILGQNSHVASGAIIGDNVKIQNNVSIYDGIIIEDDVFLGPSCVFTNVSNPRDTIDRHSKYEKTIIHKGVTIGANATIRCGISIGEYAFVGAGAVVIKDVKPYTMVVGVPAQPIGYVCKCGYMIKNVDSNYQCPNCYYKR